MEASRKVPETNTSTTLSQKVPSLPGGTSMSMAAIVPQSPIYPLHSFPQALGLISTHKTLEPLPSLSAITGDILKGVAPNLSSQLRSGKYTYSLKQ